MRHSTNNRMELTAVLEALTLLDDRPLRILSDSEYVVNIFMKWLPRWRAKGRLSPGAKKPVRNVDLIEAIAERLDGVTLEWVRGHDGHPLNERADELANAEAEWIVDRLTGTVDG